LRRDYLYPASLAWLTKSAKALGDTGSSRTVERLVLALAGRTILGCSARSQRHLPLLAATAGDVDGMFRHFEAALEMNHRMGARPALANTQHELARCLLAVDRPGDRERAQSLLAAAREAADACGLLRLSEQ